MVRADRRRAAMAVEQEKPGLLEPPNPERCASKSRAHGLKQTGTSPKEGHRHHLEVGRAQGLPHAMSDR
jgi:hypothetical protein